MLQQTQVDRVIPKYRNWIKIWPDWKSLARATPRQLLTVWSGLGYNRRAISLGKLAGIIIDRFGGRLPRNPDILRTLPGIGPYTAAAILIFAFNAPLAAIDTNIRRVIIYELQLPANISRSDLQDIAERLLPRNRSRDWHNALMDYGRLKLPRRIENLPPVPRQSPFVGSMRQLRGEIVRRLTVQSKVTIGRIARETDRSPAEVERAALDLQKDGLVRVGGTYIRLTR